MEETDATLREPAGPAEDAQDGHDGRDERDERDERDGRAGDEYGAVIGGDASGPVVVGHHNVVIDGNGSTVNLIAPQERPRPERREQTLLLPRRQRELVGRESELEVLEAAVREGGLVQLWGPPGVGKSTLLRHAARCLEPGRDGALFLSAAHREVEDLAQEIFEACYEAPGYAPTRTELRRLMAGVEVTVYVDDADLNSEQLRHLADAAPAATFVFASHERSLLGESVQVELQGLRREAGLELLARELRGPLPESERVAADELCMLSLGRPLLLLRAAGLARLDASSEVMLPRPAEIKGLLPLLFQRLDAAAMRALSLLATLRDAELAPDHIGALCEADDPDALCAELAGLGLALATERGYRCAPDAVPEVRRRSPEPFPADRLCDHFARWATSPTATPAQVADHGRALELSAELAEQQGRPDLAVRLARAVSPLLARSLRFGVWGRLLDQGQEAAQQAGDGTARAYFTHEKAIRCLLIGQRVMAAVLLAEAVVLWRELGDSQGAEAALNAQQYAPPEASAQPAPDTGSGMGADSGSPDSGADSGFADSGADTGFADSSSGSPDSLDVGPGQSPDAGTTVTAPDTGTTVTAPDAGTTASPTPDAGTTVPTPDAAATAPTPDVGTSHGLGPDLTADPTGLASSSVPPTPDSAAYLMDPITPTAAHSAGSASAGATGVGGATAGGATAGGTAAGGAAAGGAAAAGGLGAVGGVLGALLAAAVAVAVGIGIQQNQDSESTSAPTQTDELAGVWRDGGGNTFEITESGSGSYTFAVQAVCGGADTVEVTGSNGSYSGTAPVGEEASCTVLGQADMTITVASDGSTASVETTAQTNGDWECYSCGTQTWTRIE
ncbi:ATP-binding protein [Streptomyces sp. NPDC002851]